MIRGESLVIVIKNGRPKIVAIPKPKIDGVASAAIVDFLNCTFPFDARKGLNEFFQELLGVLGHAFAPAVNRNAGKYGYQHSFTLGNSTALFAYGGNAGTGFLKLFRYSLSSNLRLGETCSLFREYIGCSLLLDGMVHTMILTGIKCVNTALKMYQDGLFTNGGRKPLMDQRGNWLEPDGRGRTLLYWVKRQRQTYTRL